MRQNILLGNSGSLWKAVKIAKEINIESIPNEMFHQGISAQNSNLCDEYAKFFDTKVQNIVRNSNINPSVYNRRNNHQSRPKDIQTYGCSIFWVISTTSW